MPKVSVCIPTYNQSFYIEETIRSVLNQTLLPDEIIVSDDGSTDGTKEILKRLDEEIFMLKVIYQPENLGISRNVDECLRIAKNEFVVRLDSDDMLLPSYIEKLYEALLTHPIAGCAHAAVCEIDQFGKKLKDRVLFRKAGYQSGNEALRLAIKGYKVAANIIMFRREALQKVGYIQLSSNFAEDYYLYVQLAGNGWGNVYLPEVLSSYRVWIDSGKVRQKRKLAEIIGIRKVFEELLEPEFKKRKWNIGQLTQKKKEYAQNLSNCLGWHVYSEKEKLELIQEILKLSDHASTKLTILLYKHNLGFLFAIRYRINKLAINTIKAVYGKFRV